MTELCLIAGQGRLPEILCKAFPEARVVGPEGDAPEGVETFRLEVLGSFLSELAASGIRQVCLVGAIRRPVVDLSQIDEATQPLVPRIVTALGKGDDGALRVLVSLIEEAGMEVVGAAELCPELLPPAGALGAREPTERDTRDMDRAMSVLSTTGPADIGQGCVVAGGQVLAVEALPGTDWMLASVAAMRRHVEPAGPAREMNLKSQTLEALGLGGQGSGPDPDPARESLWAPTPAGGVLAKAPKPGQDLRVDMPTIGSDTVRRAAAAGLSGIVVASGGVIVLDREDVAQAADSSGLWVRVV
ncbi:LpxI family protein [Palleronia sp.]|uniref:LpxI family protein n=1 Tax=Palleronia sp. TaxID=1940284 RepID=UPI0035C82C1C